MSELFVPYLTVVGWVLGPVALGMLWGRLGAPGWAARWLFNVAFYGCQVTITLGALWIARIDRSPSGLLANFLAVSFDLDTDLTSSVFVVSTVAFLLGSCPCTLGCRRCPKRSASNERHAMAGL